MSQPPPAKLLVPRKEAEAKIKVQIKEAHRILASLSFQPGFDPVTASLKPKTTIETAEADREKWAKFTKHLLETLFNDHSVAYEFGDRWLHYSEYDDDDLGQLEDWMKEKIVRLESIVERLPLFALAEKPVQAKTAPTPSKQQSKDIFIVHGHDEGAKQELARVIEKLGLHPIILHQKPDKGRTIIEKFEQHSDVGFAVVLLTPDDMGHPKDKPTEPKPRARQNVVFELGYFSAMLGRSRVCALLKGDIEIPNDYAGVLYTPMDSTGAWKFKLATEINAAGIDVDLNKLK